jgi:Undecaprenyl-phosphate galactose phosphotransferase WbaP
VHNEAKKFIHMRDPSLIASDSDKRRADRRRINPILIIGDGIGLVLAWIASFALLWLIEGDIWLHGVIVWWGELGARRVALVLTLFTLALVALGVQGHYTKRRPMSDEVLDIVKTFAVVAVLDGLLVYLGRWQFSRLWFVAAWIFALLFVPLARVLVKRMLIRAGRWQRPTVILGAGQNAIEAAAALESEPLMGLKVIAFIALPGESVPASVIEVGGRRMDVLTLDDDPNTTLKRLGLPQVTVAMEAENFMPHQHLIQQICSRNADVSIVPPLRGLPLYGMEVTHFFSHEVLMLTVRNYLARPGAQFVKRLFDLLASLALIVFLSPLLAYLSWRIRQTEGDAIFGHWRVGQHGKMFRCLKFRTMVPNAEQVLSDLLASDPQVRADWEKNFKLKDDPRITGIGNFLRATSLDELPQLWNVLRGEMSLVGPRPIIEAELERYGDQVGYYLEAPPGMTGLWQISGRNNIDYDDRVALDCWYVRNWSLWYDLVVLVKTIGVVLRKDGAY